MNPKVLIATYYWPPSGGPGVQRILKFAKYLPHYGIEPEVLTVRNPTYPIQDPSLVDELPHNIKVYKSRTIEPFGLYAGLQGRTAEEIKPTAELKGRSFRSMLGSWIRANIFVPDARAGWLLSATRRARRIMRNDSIDTLLTTGPPHSVHFIGYWLKQRHNIRWIADFRDPWSKIYYNRLLPRSEWAEQIDESLERTILEQADEVIVVSRQQAEEFRKRVERGYRVITNGFDHEDFAETAEKEHHGDPTANDRRFVLRHVGHVGEAAVPEKLIGRLARMGADRPFLEFVGDVHPNLNEIIQTNRMEEWVSIRPYLPHREAIDEMKKADALLLLIPDLEEMEHHIPGKLFEYIAARRPILMLGPCNGESAAIIEEEQAGLCAPSTDGAAIDSALRKFLAGEVSGALRPPTKDHPYSRTETARLLSELIHHKDPLLGKLPEPPR